MNPLSVTTLLFFFLQQPYTQMANTAKKSNHVLNGKKGGEGAGSGGTMEPETRYILSSTAH